MKKALLSVGISLAALALTAAVGISMFPGKTVKAAGDVEINETNFPDKAFREWLKNEDYGEDGVLSEDEISLIFEIQVGPSVSDLKGIEYFTELEYLECVSADLTSLDVSKNVNLKGLQCYHNKLSSLDVSKNTKLEFLYCYDNQLKKLDLNGLTALKRLECYKNELETLNTAGCSNLDFIQCHENKLVSLDLSSSPKVKYLFCSSNDLKTLKLGKNNALLLMDCHNNKLKNLDIRTCPNIYILDCYGNDFTMLDISKCPNLIKAYTEGMEDFDNNFPDRTAYCLDWNSSDGDYEYPYRYYLGVDTDVKINKSDDVKLDKDKVSIVCGKSLALKATIKDTSAKAKWTSSDSNIATVDKSGKVKAKMAGTVSITVTAGDAFDECVVTVLYKDVKNSKDFWYNPTNYLTAEGVVKGYDKQTLFKPANECTRAQMVTFLYRLQGEPAVTAETCKFKDVKKTDYFFKPVIWAVENGITTGVSKTKFNPQGVCTRAQTVTFLWRMAKQPEPTSNTCKFKDVKKTDYFYQPVIWASEMNIVAGYSDGTFKPQGKCLRRQMVTFLYKYDKYVNGKG